LDAKENRKFHEIDDLSSGVGRIKAIRTEVFFAEISFWLGEVSNNVFDFVSALPMGRKSFLQSMQR
jgi:hypothetical protein